jgi:hypothetical protein
MDLDELVQPVTTQLHAAAALGDERTQQIATTLGAALDAAVRLAIIQAVSTATTDASFALQDLAGAGAPSFGVHVDGAELDVRITAGAAQPDSPAPSDDGDASARISLRLSEALKAELEQAAGREGISVNSWLVRAATWSLGGRRQPWPGPDAGRGGGSHRVTGWVTG